MKTLPRDVTILPRLLLLALPGMWCAPAVALAQADAGVPDAGVPVPPVVKRLLASVQGDWRAVEVPLVSRAKVGERMYLVTGDGRVREGRLEKIRPAEESETDTSKTVGVIRPERSAGNPPLLTCSAGAACLVVRGERPKPDSVGRIEPVKRPRLIKAAIALLPARSQHRDVDSSVVRVVPPHGEAKLYFVTLDVCTEECHQDSMWFEAGFLFEETPQGDRPLTRTMSPSGLDTVTDLDGDGVLELLGEDSGWGEVCAVWLFDGKQLTRVGPRLFVFGE